MLRLPPVLDFIKSVDYQFYQNVVKVLIPDVLRSIPPALTQSIRNFAKSLEGWLTSALVTYPNELIEVKVSGLEGKAAFKSFQCRYSDNFRLVYGRLNFFLLDVMSLFWRASRARF